MFRNGIYISAAPEDVKWTQVLQTFLRPHIRDEKMVVADKAVILAGNDRWKGLAAWLKNCRVVIVLVSQDYIASDDIMKNEWPAIEQERAAGELTVFIIHISHSTYDAAGLNKLPSVHDPAMPLDSLDKPERNRILVEIAQRIVNALDINAIGNMFRIIDEFVPRQQAYIENRAPDDALPDYSVMAKQEEERIALVRKGHGVFETITGDDLNKLDNDSQLLIRTYETSMRLLFERWMQLQPQSFSTDLQERQDTRDEMDIIRKDLCQQLNMIISFLYKMNKYLDDHYNHVRFICNQ